MVGHNSKEFNFYPIHTFLHVDGTRKDKAYIRVKKNSSGRREQNYRAKKSKEEVLLYPQ